MDVSHEQNYLARIQRGERDVLIDIYDAYFTQLYHFVRLKVGDATVAEDIVSDVFVRLLECIGTPQAPHTHLRGWLFRVARHELYQQLGANRAVSIEIVEETMASPEANPEVQLTGIFEMQRVQHALNMLASDHQEVLLMRFGQQLSLQETAAAMGKSISAIKSLQFRAVSTLRQILTEEQAS